LTSDDFFHGAESTAHGDHKCKRTRQHRRQTMTATLARLYACCARTKRTPDMLLRFAYPPRLALVFDGFLGV